MLIHGRNKVSYGNTAKRHWLGVVAGSSEKASRRKRQSVKLEEWQRNWVVDVGQGTERGECEREVTFNVKVEATEHDGKQRDGKQVGDPSC